MGNQGGLQGHPSVELKFVRSVEDAVYTGLLLG